MRGHEVSLSGGSPAVVLPSGFALPPGARMQLHTTDMVAAPNAFVPPWAPAPALEPFTNPANSASACALH